MFGIVRSKGKSEMVWIEIVLDMLAKCSIPMHFFEIEYQLQILHRSYRRLAQQFFVLLHNNKGNIPLLKRISAKIKTTSVNVVSVAELYCRSAPETNTSHK